MTDSTEAKESSEPKPRKLPTEASDRADPTEPIDRTEPTEPIERIDPFELTDRIEPDELSDQRERSIEHPPGRVPVVGSCAERGPYRVAGGVDHEPQPAGVGQGLTSGLAR